MSVADEPEIINVTCSDGTSKKYTVVRYLNGEDCPHAVSLAECDGVQKVLKVFADAVDGKCETDCSKKFYEDEPEIAKTFDYGSYIDGSNEPCQLTISPYFEDKDLNEWINKSHSPLEFLKFFYQCLGVLSQLKKKHIVHADIKPENIILTNEGLRPIDFGLSQIITEGETKFVGLQGTIACFPLAWMRRDEGPYELSHANDSEAMAIIFAISLLGAANSKQISDAKETVKKVNDLCDEEIEGEERKEIFLLIVLV